MKKTLEDLQIKPSKKAELCCRAMDLSRRAVSYTHLTLPTMS